MIGYFDTSAVIPLVVAESSSSRCAEIWQACDSRVSSMIVVTEAYAGLALALRIGRLSQNDHSRAARLLNDRIEELDLVIVTRAIVDSAAALALTQSLRGYDAVHAATALALRSDDTVAIASDQTLLKAFRTLGFDTIDP